MMSFSSVPLLYIIQCHVKNNEKDSKVSQNTSSPDSLRAIPCLSSKFHYWLAISKLPGNSIIEWQFSTGLALHATPVTVSSLCMSVRLHPGEL